MVDLFNGMSVDVESPLYSPSVTMLHPDVDVFVVPVQGIPGPTGGETYIHTQLAPASTWSIPHGLGTKPTIVLFTVSDGDQPVETDVHYTDDNNIVVEWPSPEAGVAYLK